MGTPNKDRQVVKDMAHMKEHLQAAQTHINLVENYLTASMQRERDTKRKEDNA